MNILGDIVVAKWNTWIAAVPEETYPESDILNKVFNVAGH